LEKYYVEDSHEAIIDRATFDAVQAEMARRAAKAHHPQKRTFTEFSGRITCGRCGAKFRKKVNAIGTKYAKVTWACATYTYRGKHECAAKRIPEDILKEKCAEVLGLVEYDPTALTDKVAGITVPDDGILVFVFKDGTERTLRWENRSRAMSWTDEMKQAARKRALGGADNG
ncbi:MAG: recombinase family protein, partial [Oscillospiraceae bacterium]|nr:recombinase family protein [Oscillospiraceae bacterium]